MRKLLLVIPLSLALPGSGGALAVGQASGTPDAQASAKRISLVGERFSPSSSSTSSGSVRFAWRGSKPHDVIFTSAPGSNPRSCSLRRSGSCTRKLRRRGTYRFLCSIHAGMTGKIRKR